MTPSHDQPKTDAAPRHSLPRMVRQKLWRVNLRSHMERYSPSYVVATDATAAYEIVRADLAKRDYGFAKDRELLSVELVAEDYEYTEAGSRLFLPNDGTHRREAAVGDRNQTRTVAAASRSVQ